ncbi:FAD-binding oxidoreductase [Skermanella aerolata]|nr:FAD-binding oxidoreductase [Skermanella aerolata]KJB95647.1 FAD-linked oxidase [Skermanella aerolata KACC 11604]
MTRSYLSWGRFHRFGHEAVRPSRDQDMPGLLGGALPHPMLAYGMGRSYGDSCLNDGGALIDMRGLDRFLDFDRDTGVLTCEAGVSLATILGVISRRAEPDALWFLPVSPGTKFVTVGGAIANDVHGKNHHGAGTFGEHVLSFRLARSDGSVMTCGPGENEPLFRATIGGLGLTGVILDVRLQLRLVSSLILEVEDIRVDSLDEFYRLSEDSLAEWEYTAAWIDCLAFGTALGRGIYTRARHAPAGTGPVRSRPAGADSGKTGSAKGRLGVPVSAPDGMLNNTFVKAFNAVYHRKLAGRKVVRRLVDFDPVFYPLDAINDWNRLYGNAGFLQYQSAVPDQDAYQTTRDQLGLIAEAGQGSFLAVLKTFGERRNPGLLSFPVAGTTLALDFPNRGNPTLDLLERLDEVTARAGGRVYPAKDGRVSAARFQASYPQWRDLAAHADPAFSSSFWRRVTGGHADHQDESPT